MFKKIIFVLALFVLMLVPAVSAGIADISFDPDPITLELLQGDSRDFYITITNSHLTDNITLSFDYTTMEDNDGDELILNFPSEITVLANSNETLTVNADIDHRLDVDTYTSTITFTDILTNDTKTLDFSAQVTIGICDFGPVGTSLQVKIKEPDSGDDFKPGDIIDIEVDVDNVGTEKIRTQVEAYLYDEDEVIESTSSSTESIEEGEDETFYLSLKIPTDSRNINENEDYTIYVKAFDDDHEEDECTQESLSVDIKLDKHDVIIEDTTRLLPSTAFCGETITAMVDVTNIGEKDEDVTITIENSELNVHETSDAFEVENFDSNSDNEGSRSFRIDIPVDAREGTYDFKVKASFSGDYSSTTLPLTVVSCETATAPAGKFDFATSNLFFKSEQSLELNPRETSTIHLLIENNAPERRMFFINIDAAGFADTISSTATIDAFASTNVFLPLTIFPEVEEGTYSATVELSDGLNTLTSETLTVQIGASAQTEEAAESLFSGTSNAGLMIAILVLLLLIIGVILLIKQI